MKRRSGPTQPEHQRLRRQVMLRLTDNERADLARLASHWGCTRSEVVSRLLRAAASDMRLELLAADV